MLKPRNNQQQKMIIWILVAVLGLAGVITLVFAFRGSSNSEEDVNAIYTNAALTVEAQQLTLSASQPSATPTATLTATPFLTNTPFAVATLPSLAAFATNTQSVSVAVGCDNSVYISDVTIPDNTAVTPGQSMTKTWKVQNNGTCAWTATYKIAFVSGNAMGGVATAIGQAVNPGQSVDISVAMVAPTAAGDASGTWRLTNDKAQAFGTPLTIVIKVGGTGGTATRTVTPGGNTSTPTATSAASKPIAANNPTITLTCNLGGASGTQYEHAGTLAWEDMSDNESGFRIYLNGAVIFTTSPNTQSYTVPSGTFRDAGFVTTFGVEAFNGAGAANVANVSQTCQ
ncbi:MAG: hypothetical protein JNM02_05510 [Anaerolineales bacterium]|nr:hypothetical protein [Anaerolineales bacterium]